MNYLLGSGYFTKDPANDLFLPIWRKNLFDHTRPTPTLIVIISVGGSWTKGQAFGAARPAPTVVLPLKGNLGHIHQLIGKETPAKPHAYCGWSASVLALALIAYNAELDFVYREQDALCFGDYIGEMYRQLGNAKMIFGSYKQGGVHMMPCAQSLFLIKHDFIPEFVKLYLEMPDDRRIDFLPETKFQRLERTYAARVKRFDFGCDRARPLPFRDPVWYAQKLTPDELTDLKRRNLI